MFFLHLLKAVDFGSEDLVIQLWYIIFPIIGLTSSLFVVISLFPFPLRTILLKQESNFLFTC